MTLEMCSPMYFCLDGWIEKVQSKLQMEDFHLQSKVSKALGFAL